MSKKTAIVIYIIIGLLPTIWMFATHDLMCKYDMNPLCYIHCALPAIIATPIFAFVGVDGY